MSRILPLAVLVALAASVRPGAAQERPRYLPTGDVAVTYAITSESPNAPKSFQAYYGAASQRLRLESEQGVVLVDLQAERASMLMPQQQIVVDLPKDSGQVHAYLLNDRTRFVRRGSETVAGLRCTDWDVTTERGRGSACLTDDGVLLRGSDAKGSRIQAVAVTRAAQPAALFEAPAGYHHVAIPRGMGAAFQPPAR